MLNFYVKGALVSHLISCIQYHAAPWLRFCKPAAVNQLMVHGSFTANPLLHQSSCIEGRGSPGWWAVLVPSPHTKLRLQTHTCICSGYIMSHFLACQLQCVHLLFFSFATVVLLLLVDMCPVLHHCAKQRGRTNIWAKTNVPRRPNLSPRLWQFITGSKRYTPLNTHRHIHINRDNTENKQKRSRSIYCNLKCVPSCVVLRLTPTHKNMKRLVCLRRQGKRNPLRSPASGIYGSKNSPILHINQK